MTETVTYAYAVARSHPGVEQALTALRGVADAPVHLVAWGRDDALVLVVSPVPAADFREDGLKEHFEDLDWLERVARAHHAVVETVASRTGVLPLRLATVYLDDTRAREVLRSEGQFFGERLDHLADQVEWGVKIYVEANAPTAPAAPDSVPEPAAEPGLTPGRAYLSARRRQRSDREAVYRAAQEAAGRVRDTARAYATDRAGHRPQQGALAEAAGENVVNDAYLVPRDRGEEFRAEVARAGRGLAGVRVEVTGPWAPYSFAVPGGDDAARGVPP
ncbi:GvpL/GvpF family gas vesicle protein [Streptomyces sp. NPDC006465]|uniref:GvpL/GvpF family gas vesicle protein n=1 Tax=Streptomyces sp. NPDC006465 TaxID=3157174 RepID=UPI0033AC0409